MTDRSDIVSLIDEWQSLGDFARDAGVTYGAAKKMRKRQSIPVTYWPALLASDTGRNRGLTSERLMRLHAPADVPRPDPTPAEADPTLAPEATEAA